MMTYKGYTGTVIAFDEKQEILHGELLGITDVITFQGKTTAEIKRAFHESVDDYLAFCKEHGKEPDRPFSGKFVVRITPQLHCQAVDAARAADKSLNAWVKMAIESALSAGCAAMPSQSAPLTVPLLNVTGILEGADPGKSRCKARISNSKKKVSGHR